MYLLLYVLWIALNGKVTAEICILGLVVVSAVALIGCGLFHYTPATELYLYRRVPLLAVYLFVLVWEIIKANFSVLHFILHQKGAIEPAVMSFNVDLKSRWTRFLLANSITLTPGTITLFANDDRFVVHALTSEMLDGIETSRFVEMLKKMEAKS